MLYSVWWYFDARTHYFRYRVKYWNSGSGYNIDDATLSAISNNFTKVTIEVLQRAMLLLEVGKLLIYPMVRHGHGTWK